MLFFKLEFGEQILLENLLTEKILLSKSKTLKDLRKLKAKY